MKVSAVRRSKDLVSVNGNIVNLLACRECSEAEEPANEAGKSCRCNLQYPSPLIAIVLSNNNLNVCVLVDERDYESCIPPIVDLPDDPTARQQAVRNAASKRFAANAFTS